MEELPANLHVLNKLEHLNIESNNIWWFGSNVTCLGLNDLNISKNNFTSLPRSMAKLIPKLSTFKLNWFKYIFNLIKEIFTSTNPRDLVKFQQKWTICETLDCNNLDWRHGIITNRYYYIHIVHWRALRFGVNYLGQRENVLGHWRWRSRSTKRLLCNPIKITS